MSRGRPQREAEAFRYCRDVTRRRARNFYYGLKLTPEPQRSALFSIYAWMRRADDLVDGTGDDRDANRLKLESFRAATDKALAGEAADGDPLWVALADTAGRFELDGEALHMMIDGQVDDLSIGHYRTFDDVHRYCYRVASTVALVCIGIWGYEGAAARQLAVDRGIAFQLTNILRDFKEDYHAGRVYLPEEDFERNGITPGELRRWSKPQVCRRFVREQTARAESFYARSGPLDRMITRTCRPTLWAMTAIYHGLLRKIERFPRRVISGHRLRLSSLRKGVIALRAKRLGRRSRATEACP